MILLKAKYRGDDEKIYNEIRTLVPGVPAVTLRNIANNVATEYSNDMVQDVNLSTNKQLNEIPKNITGPINPVNLTNSNNGPQDIFNNVQNIIQTQHASSYTDKVSSSVISQLKNLLQPGQLNNLNLNNLNNNLPLNLSSTISSTINTALNGSLASTFSTRNNIPEFIPGVSNLFENNDSNTALEKIDEQFNISSASLVSPAAILSFPSSSRIDAPCSSSWNSSSFSAKSCNESRPSS